MGKDRGRWQAGSPGVGAAQRLASGQSLCVARVIRTTGPARSTPSPISGWYGIWSNKRNSSPCALPAGTASPGPRSPPSSASPGSRPGSAGASSMNPPPRAPDRPSLPPLIPRPPISPRTCWPLEPSRRLVKRRASRGDGRRCACHMSSVSRGTTPFASSWKCDWWRSDTIRTGRRCRWSPAPAAWSPIRALSQVRRFLPGRPSRSGSNAGMDLRAYASRGVPSPDPDLLAPPRWKLPRRLSAESGDHDQFTSPVIPSRRSAAASRNMMPAAINLALRSSQSTRWSRRLALSGDTASMMSATASGSSDTSEKNTQSTMYWVVLGFFCCRSPSVRAG